ncbi:hypothetical protein CVT24_010017 [Panaeolus cyanescens]|uniref:Fungal lipase-type domain-containing protein n=1 Tax=Panaeolus cyanescens TaxID=181874 RepID=A0A409W3Y0_9AGAR|nr:hypothetical protein CVT24_010017 [Panaeolus cyanescens]
MFLKSLFSLLVAVCLIPVAAASPSEATAAEQLNNKAISNELFNDLTWYMKYATSAYTPSNQCPYPNGQTLVTGFEGRFTDTRGYIARDDSKKQIVVSFVRYTNDSAEKFVDSNAVLLLDPFLPSGISYCNEFGPVLVHRRFLTEWSSVSSFVLDTISKQLIGRSEYDIVTVGHSVGGAIASLAALTIKLKFPFTKMYVYTYGQPRTGNLAYAKCVNKLFGTGNSFRVTHTKDLIPHLPHTINGYVHHGVEYWITKDPASVDNIVACNESGEDRTCSRSVPKGDLSILDHLKYMEIFAPFQSFCNRSAAV